MWAIRWVKGMGTECWSVGQWLCEWLEGLAGLSLVEALLLSFGTVGSSLYYCMGETR